MVVDEVQFSKTLTQRSVDWCVNYCNVSTIVPDLVNEHQVNVCAVSGITDDVLPFPSVEKQILLVLLRLMLVGK